MTGRRDRLRGLLLGTAIGDALGLPAEGMSAKTVARRFPQLDRYRLLGRTGFVSDDTEQSALVAQALVRGRSDDAVLRRAFRRSMAGWFLRLPWGLGWATLRACVKVLVGVRRSGVRSAGNGAAMRAAIVGGAWSQDGRARTRQGQLLAEVTHTDPRGVEGALFVAELAALCVEAARKTDRGELVTSSLRVVEATDLRAAIERGIELSREDLDPAAAGKTLGNSGFVLHTLSLGVWAFLRGGHDPMEAIRLVIRAGGDTDSIGAIVGAWCGALHGESGLPDALIDALQRGPFGSAHLRALADLLAVPPSGAEPPAFSALVAMIRNLLLYPVVLAHGFRRVIPW